MISIGTVLDRHRGIGPGFDFLRIFLAICIVFVHALLATGLRPWFDQSPLWFLEYGLVPMFFALSGFLITGSAMRLSLGNFLVNRGLRIVPALAVDIVVCALVIGPLMTTLPLSEYVTDPRFRAYFLNIVGYIHYLLPGVFEDHVSKNVNGALWTVPYEILCYVLASFFIVFAWLHHRWKVALFTFAMMALGTLVSAFDLAQHLPRLLEKVTMFALVSRKSQIVTAFLLGVVAYQWRHRIPYSRTLFLACAGLCVAAALWPEAARPVGARFVLLPALAYMTVFIGLTAVPIPAYFHKGDYSYGIYLYHDPLLQVTISLFPAIAMIPFWGAGFTFAVGLAAVMVLANVSWHFIEKPILSLRKKFSFVARVRELDDAPAPPAAPAAAEAAQAGTAPLAAGLSVPLQASAGNGAQPLAR